LDDVGTGIKKQMLCPLLGTLGDPQICLTYPHYQNRCYADGRGNVVDQTLQARYCTSPRWMLCPLVKLRGIDQIGKQLSVQPVEPPPPASIPEAPPPTATSPTPPSGSGQGFFRYLVLWLIVMAVGSAAVVALLIGTMAYQGDLSWPTYTDGPRRVQAAGMMPDLGRSRLATFLFGTPTSTAPAFPPAEGTAAASGSLRAVPTFTPLSATATSAPAPKDTATSTPPPTAKPTLSTPIATFLPLPANVEGSPVPTVVPVESAPPPLAITPATSPPTRIVAPTIGLDAPVVPVGWHVEEQNGQKVAVWDVADYAAGWHKNSAYPGAVGNTVLSGHHNIKGEVFRYLVDLKVGDPIYLYAGDRRYDYVVRRTMIVKEKGEPREKRLENARWIARSDDIRLTLVTCWPYTNNTHRVIIVALPK